MGLDVMIDPVIAEKIEVKSLFPFFWDTLYLLLQVQEVHLEQIACMTSCLEYFIGDLTTLWDQNMPSMAPNILWSFSSGIANLNTPSMWTINGNNS